MKTMKINIVNYLNDIDHSKTIELVGNAVDHKFSLQKMEVSIILVGNDKIQELNRQYREKDYPTDVLTFPDGEHHYLGDIVISLEKCEEQRLSYNHSFERELGFLVVHGLLHTLGYDHISKEDEIEMFLLQDNILETIELKR